MLFQDLRIRVTTLILELKLDRRKRDLNYFYFLSCILHGIISPFITKIVVILPKKSAKLNKLKACLWRIITDNVKALPTQLLALFIKRKECYSHLRQARLLT